MRSVLISFLTMLIYNHIYKNLFLITFFSLNSASNFMP